VIDITPYIAISTVQHTRWGYPGVSLVENTLNFRIFLIHQVIIVDYVHVVKHQYVLNQNTSKIKLVNVKIGYF